MLTLALSALPLLVPGCVEGTQSEWRILFDTPALGERALSVRVEVLAGGCDGEDVLYRAVIDRMTMAMETPPDLDEGRYGFRATARDAACLDFALACEEVELPMDAGTIRLDLTEISERTTCEADACVDGICGPCTEDRADCDGDEANGCETDTRASQLHCGDCDTPCERANASAACAEGVCTIASCNDGFADCNGDPSDGCETELATDSTHCGECGRACSLAGAMCVDNRCSVLSCEAGLADCDEDPDNGCEVALASDAGNCGTCGRSCGLGGTCIDGTCDDILVDFAGPFVPAFIPVLGTLPSGRVVSFRAVNGGGSFELFDVDDAVELGFGIGWRCALRETGTIVCWDFSGGNRRELTGATDIVRLGASPRADYDETRELCALRASGEVLCWEDAEGEPTPVGEIPPLRDLATSRVSCGVTTGDEVVCWGDLHPATTCSGEMPSAAAVTIPGFPASTRVAVSEALNVCAIATDGQLYCAGQNAVGQTGTRRVSTCETAGAVVPLTDVRDVDVEGSTASSSFACALDGEGALWCWGFAGSLLPGDGRSDRPVRVAGVNDAVRLGMFNQCACTLSGDGIFDCTGVCFGIAARASVRGAVQLALGRGHTCARRVNGRVACWGVNVEGQLGTGDTNPLATPELLEATAPVARDIAAGARHSCLVSQAGEVYCWGDDSEGQLGTADTMNRSVPTLVDGLSGITRIFAGDAHTCAVRDDEHVLCWGANDQAQIDAESPAMVETPFDLGTRSFVAVAGDTTCTSMSNAVECHGALTYSVARFHQELFTDGVSVCLRNGVSFDCAERFLEPDTGVRAPSGTGLTRLDLSTPINDLALGQDHACAALTDGTVSCWGDNTFGQLGAVEPMGASPRLSVEGLGDVTQITAGPEHTCARSVRGTVSCWGAGTFGQLGDGTTMDRRTPVEAQGLR